MNRSKKRKANLPNNDKSIKTKQLPHFSTFSFYLPLLVFMVGILCYSNTFHNPFVFDDLPHIVELEGIHLDSLSHNKLNRLWEAIRVNGRPVALVSFALNYYFDGLNTIGYHLINLSIHLFTSILVYLFLKQTLNLPILRERYGKWAREIALLTSLLFVAHPIQIQSVSYIIQRMTSMAVFFFMLAFYFYGKARSLAASKKKTAYFIGSILAALLALGSKQISITLPFFIVLYEYLFWQRYKPNQPKKSLVYIIIGLVLVLGLLVGIYSGFSFAHIFKGYQERSFTPGQRMLTQLRVVIFYLGLLIAPIPSHLNLDHHFPLSYSLFNPSTTLLCLGLILSVVFCSIYLAKKRPLISFAIIWFWGNLALESSVLPLELAFEHRLYLPSVGFFLLVSIVFVKVFERLRMQPRLKMVIKAGGVIVLIVPLSVMTYQRNRVWQNEITLWEDAVKKSPGKARAHRNLGYVYENRGLMAKAVNQYQRSLKLEPGIKNVYSNLGNVYLKQGKTEQAVAEYLLEIKHHPDNARAYYDLGYAYTKQGKLEEAAFQYRFALDKDPGQKDVHNNLGKIYILQNKPDLAAAEFIEEIKHYSNNAKAYYNLGLTFVRKGLKHKALLSFQQAVHVAPDFAEAHRDLGILYLQANTKDKAVLHFVKSLALNPDISKAEIMRQIIKKERG